MDSYYFSCLASASSLRIDNIDVVNDSHLEHLQFSNVSFETFGNFVSHRFFPKLTSVKLWLLSTSSQIFDCDVDIHKDFMSNFSLAVPNLVHLSIENAGLSIYAADW